MQLDVHIDNGVATVLLDRPRARNALTVDLVHDLDTALQGLAGDGVRCLVLAGSGTIFCAGADLALVRDALKGDPAAVLAPLVDGLHAVIMTLRNLPFPTVSAIEGPAVGAGMGLALATDLRIVARSAEFVPGYFGIGASPDGGVSYFLTRALGAARASAVLVRGRTLSSEQIVRWGLAEDVVDDGSALRAAAELAATLTGTPALALVRARRLVDLATTQNLAAQLDEERRLVAQLWPTSDFREGVTAFLEKRKPTFQGR
jgi:2-(1,2-epoxy-1,2-dihydrophenyl)acetyl-CoA isomerase